MFSKCHIFSAILYCPLRHPEAGNSTPEMDPLAVATRKKARMSYVPEFYLTKRTPVPIFFEKSEYFIFNVDEQYLKTVSIDQDQIDRDRTCL